MVDEIDGKIIFINKFRCENMSSLKIPFGLVM